MGKRVAVRGRLCLLLAATCWIGAVSCSERSVPPPAYISGGQNMEKASFAAGCFWGVESVFRAVPGVVDATVGYSGGTTKDPTYEQVCTGKTNHAETLLVEYDPAKVSYEKLLDIFWANHDPTTLNRQGPDVGSQYRSVIFYHTPEQKTAALASLKRLEASGKFKQPIVTQIVPAATFYRAEEYHQRYNEKHGRSCNIH